MIPTQILKLQISAAKEKVLSNNHQKRIFLNLMTIRKHQQIIELKTRYDSLFWYFYIIFSDN